ncbi:MAG: L,D-transpeptidase/peptidoglycan binding protein [Lachnospiraceae bacterium]|nr:L,D-transpeptidase/peptidoglycan binding protein [Lachnospiraceae bacterium]
MKKGAIIGLAVGGTAIVALGAVYFVGRNFYKDHFLAGTTINGIDCSNMTVDMAKEEIQFELDNYKLVVSERGDLEDTLKGKDMDFLYTDGGEVDQLMENQSHNMWIFKLMGNKSYEFEHAFTYSEDKMVDLVDAFQCFKPENVVQPEDAKPVLENGEFVVKPEVEGSLIYTLDVENAIKDVIMNNVPAYDLDEAGLYIQPQVRKDNPELLAKVDQMNAMTKADITYDFVEKQYHVDREEMAGWVSTAEDGSIIVDREKVADWVRNMAYETDTFGLEKDFTTSYGRTITLAGGGDYGYCIDQEATTDQLINFIIEAQTVVTEPVYLYTGLDRTGNTIGKSYVEICISTQTLWLYWDGQLITSTPIITGCDEKGYSTPSGSCWAIDGKKMDWNFTTFPNAWSTWWMPFNDQVGLHDASWQDPSYYEIPGFYISNGSHGCVNIPDAPMEQIFNYMEIGYPVVVYYSEDQVVGPAPTEDLVAG